MLDHRAEDSCCYLYSIFSNIWGLRDSNPFYFHDSFQSEGLEPSLPSVDPHVLQVWYRTPARVELVGNGSQTRFVPAGHPVSTLCVWLVQMNVSFICTDKECDGKCFCI